MKVKYLQIAEPSTINNEVTFDYNNHVILITAQKHVYPSERNKFNFRNVNVNFNELQET